MFAISKLLFLVVESCVYRSAKFDAKHQFFSFACLFILPFADVRNFLDRK